MLFLLSIIQVFFLQDIPNIFSAGMDIHEMYKPNVVRLEKFWSTFQTLWINLYGSRLPVIASISVCKGSKNEIKPYITSIGSKNEIKPYITSIGSKNDIKPYITSLVLILNCNR